MFFDWPLRIYYRFCNEEKKETFRRSCGIFAGWIGVGVNIFLAVIKFCAAFYSGSVAIAVDAVNNLSDAGSGIVTVVGFKIAGKPADDEHPFGHGRVEYIAGLIVSVIIVAVGLNFLKESVGKCIHPSAVRMNMLTAAFLGCAIFCKFWLFGFFRAVGIKADAPALKAAAVDSLSDLAITALILVAMFAGKFTSFPVDGIAGCLVALGVIYAGIKVLREIADPLIGVRPQKELVEELVSRLLDCPGICGVHDCIIHSYGPDLLFATAHAEVQNEGDLLAMHDVLEKAEVEIAKSMSITLVLHCDPFNVADPTVLFWRRQLENAAAKMDKRFKIYDFRYENEQEKLPHIRFHLLVNRCDMPRRREITQYLEGELQKTDPNVRLEIFFVNAFV